jgi:hypothetical protein
MQASFGRNRQNKDRTEVQSALFIHDRDATIPKRSKKSWIGYVEREPLKRKKG